jgi:hypothetical protein
MKRIRSELSSEGIVVMRDWSRLKAVRIVKRIYERLGRMAMKNDQSNWLFFEAFKTFRRDDLHGSYVP